MVQLGVDSSRGDVLVTGDLRRSELERRKVFNPRKVLFIDVFTTF
jgi:hypothetical protein